MAVSVDTVRNIAAPIVSAAKLDLEDVAAGGAGAVGQGLGHRALVPCYWAAASPPIAFNCASNLAHGSSRSRRGVNHRKSTAASPPAASQRRCAGLARTHASRASPLDPAQVHPTLSTVTYLTAVGAPTLVLNTRGIPASSNPWPGP